MGYDLAAKNPGAGEFHFGAFAWPNLLDHFGYLFPCVHSGPRWYCVFGADPRMPQGDQYPRLISNDGFEVTDEESRIMARMTRNVVAVQRSLSDDDRTDPLSHEPPKWPSKFRDDWTDQYEKFADWAEKSGGFSIH